MKVMKRVVNAAQDTMSGRLYAQYLSFGDIASGDITLRSMTVTRPTLSEALTVMLEHIELPEVNLDYDEMLEQGYTTDEIIEEIVYANGSGMGADFIVYLENRASGEVFIDNTGAEENY